jgi:HSP20 family protein
MPLIPWKPFRDLDEFFEEGDRFFPMVPRFKLMEPAMDIYETDKEVVAELDLPGIDPDKVEVLVKNQVLRVKGEMEEKKEAKEKGYWRREIRRGSFERMVRLPVPVKEDKVEATYEKGLLKIVMPKLEEKKPPEKKIKIRVKEA